MESYPEQNISIGQHGGPTAGVRSPAIDMSLRKYVRAKKFSRQECVCVSVRAMIKCLTVLLHKTVCVFF